MCFEFISIYLHMYISIYHSLIHSVFRLFSNTSLGVDLSFSIYMFSFNSCIHHCLNPLSPFLSIHHLITDRHMQTFLCIHKFFHNTFIRTCSTTNVPRVCWCIDAYLTLFYYVCSQDKHHDNTQLSKVVKLYFLVLIDAFYVITRCAYFWADAKFGPSKT